MKPVKMHIAQDLSELLDLIISMLLQAPKFTDRTGYMPFMCLDYVFRELDAGLNHNRQKLGEERYQQLRQMSDEIRPLFEADPEDKTGETLKGRKIILQMEEILRQALRKS